MTDADDELTIRLAFNGKPKSIDLCAEHKNPDWETMTQCWTDDPGAAPSISKTDQCPWCGEYYTSKQGVLMHALRKHPNIPLEEQQAKLGFKVTDRNARPREHEAEDGSLKYSCPTCDRIFDTEHGMRMHMVRTHKAVYEGGE